MTSDGKPVIEATAWDKAFEPALYEQWKRDGVYAFPRTGKGSIYSIDTPPPYVNSPVHIGHAATYVLMDMFARFHRMKGDRVLFPLGLDNNGLPIELGAEKKYKVRLHELKREEALALCRKLLDEAGMESMSSFLRLGIGFNSWTKGSGIGEVYETDSADYRALTQETFIDMWEKGLIYEDTRINNWDPALQTTVSDAEVVYEDIPSSFNDIVFKVKATGEDIVIGTTRPELVCTCAMIIFNPEDGRYKQLDGKTAITPVFGKEVPIKAHPLAEIDKGTGLVMMCSAGDLADIRFFREQGLTPVIAINKDGRMNDYAGPLKGLKVKEARAHMIDLCKQKGLLVGQKQVTHRTPISERSKTPIEFIAMPELYVRQLDMKDTMRQIAHDLTIYEEPSRQILLDWIESISIDWPITRRRFYATDVPLWYCTKCRKPVLGQRGTYVQPWREAPPVRSCGCGNTAFEGDGRVLDTWFDSSISPLYILKWHRDEAFFKEAKRATLRPQGKEIVRTWLYFTLLKCHMLTGERIFDSAWIHHHIVDEKGNKMSKSTGNIIDPKRILDEFGAEPFRLWAAVEGNLPSTDFRCSNDRIKAAGKTLTKLWNVARFASAFPKAAKDVKPTALDAWIRAELAGLVKLADEHYLAYDFHDPALALRHFIWETFASHYLELVKARAYNHERLFSEDEQQSALATISHVLDITLKLLAPVTPFITQRLYQELHGKDIHFEAFPTAEKIEAPFETGMLEEFNGMVWKAKKDKGLSLRAPVETLTVPRRLEAISKELGIMHGAKTVAIGEAGVVLA